MFKTVQRSSVSFVDIIQSYFQNFSMRFQIIRGLAMSIDEGKIKHRNQNRRQYSFSRRNVRREKREFEIFEEF